MFDVLARRGALLSQDFVVYLETLPEVSFLFSVQVFCIIVLLAPLVLASFC